MLSNKTIRAAEMCSKVTGEIGAFAEEANQIADELEGEERRCGLMSARARADAALLTFELNAEVVISSGDIKLSNTVSHLRLANQAVCMSLSAVADDDVDLLRRVAQIVGNGIV